MLFGEFLAGHTQKTVVFNPLDNLPIMALTVLLELKCMFQMASPRASLDLEAFVARRLLAGLRCPEDPTPVRLARNSMRFLLRSVVCNT